MSKELERMSVPKLSLKMLEEIVEQKDIGGFKSLVGKLIDEVKAEKVGQVCAILCT